MAGKIIRAFIAGCSGPELTAAETAFFRHANPWGLILFGRNCQSPQQLRALTASFRAAVGRKDAPVLIDQEGGRVQRMSPQTGPWRAFPSPAVLGLIYENCPIHAFRVARNLGRLIARDLHEAGITVNCAPVLDVPRQDTHPIISARAFAKKPETALALARAHVGGLLAGGVLPVIKHMPGHGRAAVDSHLELPRITASRRELESVDFLPFAAFADAPMGMTCHVVFDALDPQNPVTLSRAMIRDVIRRQIGFQGLLMTDDISMKAISGSYAERTVAAIAAGCDIVLHCNGNMDEMQEVAAAAPILSGRALARAKAALRQCRKPMPFDEKAALKDLEHAMERAAMEQAA